MSERSKSVALKFGNGAGESFTASYMHFRVDRKRIVGAGWVKVLEEKSGRKCGWGIW